MRLLFLFLLLVNAFVYFWYTSHKQTVNASPTSLEGDYPRLVLLSELPPEASSVKPQPPVSEPDEEVVAEEPSAPPRTCYTLGPFMNDDDVSKAAQALIQTGRPIEKRASEKREQIGYWVFFPAFATREEALAKAGELKLLGEKHLYVVKEPEEYRNTISLGVFKSKKNAEKRFRQINNLGYDVKLEGRYRQNPVYWIDYSEQEGSKSVDLEGFVGAHRLDRSCETVASGPPLP